MPRSKDTKSDKMLKGAERESSEVSVGDAPEPECQSNNALVRQEWDMYAPPLIRAGLVNFATQLLFTDICFHQVVLKRMQEGMFDENVAWFEIVQNYGDGGEALTGEKEAGRLKTYRQWSASYRGLLKELSLRPRDMADLWNMKQSQDDGDLFI